MIRYKTWAIVLDSEYPVVSMVKTRKEGENVGVEYLVPTYFPRDMEGAFRILSRVTTVDATRDCKNLAEAIKAIDKNHEELLKLVKELK